MHISYFDQYFQFYDLVENLFSIYLCTVENFITKSDILRYMKKIVLFMAAVFVLAGCSEKKSSKEIAPVKVVTMEVGLSQGNVERSYVGTVKESYGSALSFATAGTVRQVLVNEGQAVKQGQTLATLDDSQLRNSYAIAKATLAQAEDGFKRMDQLYKKGSLPAVKYVDIQTKLSEAQSSEKMARKMLNDCVLKAPFSGYIAKRSVDVGQNVMPGLSCFDLVKLDNIEVSIPIPEQEIANIKTGQEMSFTVAALGNRRFTGKVTKKGVQADVLSHTYNVTLSLSNGDHALLPGMVCSVESHSNTSSSIVVPQEAVLTDGKQQFVWINKGGKAQRRSITTSGVTSAGVVISSGLTTGEKLIVSGQNKVSEGTKVTEK